MSRFLNSTAFALALASFLAPPALAQEQGEDAVDDQEGVLQEIVVKGIRSSVQQSTRLKRDANGIVDAVVAQDIGKMTDENIAEALQRITGVAIDRVYGEGSTVSVRGLSPDLSLVTLNGTPMTTNTDSRTIDFSLYSAHMLKSIEVKKTPSADDIEGAIGGIIKLASPRPLDRPEPIYNGTVEWRRNGLSGEGTGAARLNVLDQMADNKIGLALGATFENGEKRTDQLGTGGWQRQNATIDGEVVNGAMARTLSSRLDLLDTERTGVTGTLEYRPNDVTHLNLDAGFSRYEVIRNTYRFNQNFVQGLRFVIDDSCVLDNYGTFTRCEYGVGPNPLSQGTRIDSLIAKQKNIIDTTSVGFGSEYFLNDWTFSVDLGWSNSKEKVPELQRLNFVQEPRAASGYDLSNPIEPRIINAETMPTDPNIPLNQINFIDRGVDDENLSAAFDAAYDLGGSWVSDVSFGIRYAERSKFRQDTRAVFSYRNRVPLLERITTGDVMASFPVSNFMPGEGGTDLVREWAVVDLDSAYALAEEQVDVPAAETRPSTYDITEDTLSGYIMLELEALGGRLYGDVGLRFAETDVESSGFLQSGQLIEPVTVDHNYSNTLPAMNLVYVLRNDMLLRFASAKVIGRPALNEAAPNINFTIAGGTGRGGNPLLMPYEATQFDLSFEWYFQNGGLLGITAFHKEIDTFVFNRRECVRIPNPNGGFYVHNGSACGEDDELFAMLRPENGNGGRISGLEFNYRHQFKSLPGIWSGLGVNANYTYTDSKAEFLSEQLGVPGQSEIDLPFPSQSEHTVNATVYWEYNDHSVLLSYNHRSDYLLTPSSTIGNTIWVDSIQRLDASANIRLSDRTQLSLHGVNLTNDLQYNYASFAEEGSALSGNVPDHRLVSYVQTGRTFRISLRYSF